MKRGRRGGQREGREGRRAKRGEEEREERWVQRRVGEEKVERWAKRGEEGWVKTAKRVRIKGEVGRRMKREEGED